MIAALCHIALSSALLFLAPVAGDAVETGMRVGQRHLDIELPTLDGELARLSDYRGKKVVLIHFASW